MVHFDILTFLTFSCVEDPDFSFRSLSLPLLAVFLDGSLRVPRLDV